MTVGLDDAGSPLTDPRQYTERQVEGMALLEQIASMATPREAKIIRLLVDGLALHEAARFLKMPKAVAVSCMEDFCCRVRVAIG